MNSLNRMGEEKRQDIEQRFRQALPSFPPHRSDVRFCDE